jgi:hypothetical protein
VFTGLVSLPWMDCDTTTSRLCWPFGFFTFPSLQCALRNALRAWATVLPRRFGTLHCTAGSGSGGGGDELSEIVTDSVSSPDSFPACGGPLSRTNWPVPL